MIAEGLSPGSIGRLSADVVYASPWEKMNVRSRISLVDDKKQLFLQTWINTLPLQDVEQKEMLKAYLDFCRSCMGLVKEFVFYAGDNSLVLEPCEDNLDSFLDKISQKEATRGECLAPFLENQKFFKNFEKEQKDENCKFPNEKIIYDFQKLEKFLSKIIKKVRAILNLKLKCKLKLLIYIIIGIDRNDNEEAPN
jgi:hypothetical protein